MAAQERMLASECVLEAKSMVRLHGCTGTPQPSLLSRIQIICDGTSFLLTEPIKSLAQTVHFSMC